MIALKLTNTKSFMNQLLCSEMFDHFLLPEATITKDASFTINGHIHSSFYSQAEQEEEGLLGYTILPYARLRPICYQLIRGKHTPVSFKFVLMLSPENTANVLARSSSSYTANDINGIFLNLSFQNGQLYLTTGISYAIFAADHTLEQEWDMLVQKFLAKHGTAYEEM